MTNRPTGEDGIRDIESAVARCYSTWGERYYDDYYGADAPYPPVHRDLIVSMLNEFQPKRVLDAGCGPASILRHLVAPGRELYGFDLTPEMIAESRRVMTPLGMSESRLWIGSVLDAKAYAPPNEEQPAYDCALCVGVLPHLPDWEEKMLIQNLRNSVRSGGLVLVEGRNELFSLFTMNRYSCDFAMERLVPSAELLREAGEEKEALESVLSDFKAMFRTDIPPIRKGHKDEPGYDEIVSRLHNPIVLKKQFETGGFREVKPLFYHFHCLPPMFGSSVPQLFRKQSLAMERNPEDWRGYFMASAFIIAAIRS